MKVAYFSPMPPSTSGIADYSALLLPELRKLIDVEVISEPRRGMGKGCDIALYHVGNNPEHHGWIVERCPQGRKVATLEGNVNPEELLRLGATLVFARHTSPRIRGR